jgi:hypothetical protein
MMLASDSDLAVLVLLTGAVFLVIAATIVLTLWFAGPRRSDRGRPTLRL